MELKRILARDTRAATEKAIALYGADVLIISNHQIHGETELVVAIDLADESAEASSQPMHVQPGQTGRQSAGGKVSFDSVLTQSQKANFNRAAQNSADAEAEMPSPESNARDYLRSREIVELVREELAGLRKEFRLGQQTLPWRANLNLAPALQPLVEAMNQSQIPQGLLALLLDSLKDLQTPEEALQVLRQEMSQILARQTANVPTPTEGVHIMAGPSGAGKTLMAARLLNNALSANVSSSLEPEDVALISYQDTRVGAWSQTQMLAAKMGIDCFRAPTQDILRVVMEELSGKKFIVIDTPGVQMALRVQEVLAAIPKAQCHAVMPADSSNTSLDRVLLKSNLPIQSLFLSKLDEASPPWSLLDFLSHNSCAVSACSTGDHLQNLMPDFSLQHLLDLAFLPLSPRPTSSPEMVSQMVSQMVSPLPTASLPPQAPVVAVPAQPSAFAWR